MAQQGTQKEPWTARQWLVVFVAGLLVGVLFHPVNDSVGAVGFMVATFGAIGLAWRLLKGR